MVIYAHATQAAGGAGGWVNLATSDLDMNNFSINNINTAIIVQTTTTGQALDVSRNLAAASTNEPVVCFENTNATDDQAVLLITQNSPADGIFITGAATMGVGLEVDQNGDNYGIEIQSAATTNTQYGLQIVTGAGATVANFQYSGNEFIRVGLHNDASGTTWFYRNLAAADTAGAVVFIEQDEATDDQSALEIQQDGTGSAINIVQTGSANGAIRITNTGNTSYGLNIYSDTGATAVNPLVKLEIDNVAFDQYLMFIENEGVLPALYIRQVTTITGGGGDSGAIEVSNNGALSSAIRAYTNTANPTNPLVVFWTQTSSFLQDIVWINSDSNGIALHIEHDDAGATVSQYIDRNGSNAADIWALKIDCDNAGAGAPGGIDLSSFAVGEALLKVPVDTCTPTAAYGAILVDVIGVGLKAIKLYDCPA